MRAARQLGLGAAAIPAAAAVVSCGGSSTSTSSTAHHPAPPGSKTPSPVPRGLSVASIGTLPAAVQDTAVAPLPGGRAALLGGID